VDEDAPPEGIEMPDGVSVFFEPARYPPEQIEAELPDGTRLPSVRQLGGRRLGFDRLLPRGSWILRNGVRTWGPVGVRRKS
jgi:hypothetical protein